MAAPTRFTSGITQAAKWQPLGDAGFPDPFFYSSFEDDYNPYVAGYYTVTATGGSVAQNTASNIGGRILLTTGATAGNFAELQVAPFIQYTAGKRLFFLTRLQVASATTSQFVAGLISSNVTPLTSVADGIYVSKAAGSTNLVLNAVTGGASRGTATLSGILNNNTDIDLGIEVDRQGNVKLWAGSSLEGVKRPESANLGPNASILYTSLSGALTSALLGPTIALGNGTTAAAMTGISDFLLGAMER